MSSKRWIFQITEKEKARLGLYKALAEEGEIEIVQWHIKEGELISGIFNEDSGSIIGPRVVTVNAEKGDKDVEAVGEEIGARIKKILAPEGKIFKFDLRKEPFVLVLAELEREEHGGEQGDPQLLGETLGAEAQDTQKSYDKTNGTAAKVFITPMAKKIMEENGIVPEEIFAKLPSGILRITREYVEKYLSDKNSLVNKQESSSVLASPAVRRLAKEHGVDIAKIVPSHPDGRVREEDILEFLESSKTVVAETVVDKAKSLESEGEFEIVKPSLRRKATARHLKKAWETMPHAGPGMDIDPVPLIAFRNEWKEPWKKYCNLDLRLDHFVIAACRYLLKQEQFKILNAYWHEENGESEIRLYKHVNIGVAVSIPRGIRGNRFSELVIPCIKKSETLNFKEIIEETERLIKDAQSGHPKSDDQQGVSFVVDNVGSPVEWDGKKFPGDEFPSPLLSPETSSVLAFGTARDVGDKKKMHFVLRFDHRTVDGREEITFLRALQYLLEHPLEIIIL